MASSGRSVEPVVLIGMMGAGKSTVGRRLAERLGLPFGDLDAALEAQAGATIVEVFTREGEAAFREREADALDEVMDAGGVVAAGGGVVLHPRSRERLRQAPRVVWLRASPETLASRVGEGQGRPLLDGDDVVGRLRSLYEVRRPLYQEVADLVVDVDHLTVDEVVESVVAGVNP